MWWNYSGRKKNLVEKNITCKTQNFSILITNALLIAHSIYCYLIKYQAKQKHFNAISGDKIKTNLYW